MVCRGRSVCPANSVCAQTQKAVMESAAGNEGALTSSVARSAEAPAALPVYNNSTFSAFPPDSINPFVCILPSLLFIRLSLLFVSLLSFPSLSQALRTRGGNEIMAL